jgi:hypothetical protein
VTQQVEAVRGSPGADLAVPGASLVFNLGMDAAAMDVNADGEGPAWLSAGGVRDGVGGQFAGQQDGVVCGGAAGQEGPQGGAHLAGLVGAAGVGAFPR